MQSTRNFDIATEQTFSPHYVSDPKYFRQKSFIKNDFIFHSVHSTLSLTQHSTPWPFQTAALGPQPLQAAALKTLASPCRSSRPHSLSKPQLSAPNLSKQQLLRPQPLQAAALENLAFPSCSSRPHRLSKPQLSAPSLSKPQLLRPQPFQAAALDSKPPQLSAPQPLQAEALEPIASPSRSSRPPSLSKQQLSAPSLSKPQLSAPQPFQAAALDHLATPCEENVLYLLPVPWLVHALLGFELNGCLHSGKWNLKTIAVTRGLLS